MIRQVSSLLVLWLAVASSSPISPQQQQHQLALAAASQQQAQQYQQQPIFAAGHGQFAGQRGAYAAYQPAPVAYQAPQPRPQIALAPQQIAAYQQIPQPVRKAPRPINPNAPQQPLQGEEDYDPNPAYNFSFDVKDDTFTNYQNRKEQREGDKITGSYSVVDSDGFIRTVTYTADPLQGFKAEVTREPTDIVVKLPTPQIPAAGLPAGGYSPQPAPQYRAQVAASPAPVQQHQPAPQPQYIAQSAPQQQAYLRQAQLQQALQGAYRPQPALQGAYRPSAGKASLGGARVAVPVAGGLIYQPQQHHQAAYQQ